MKDTITNICGIIVVVGGSLLSAHAAGQIVLPEPLLVALGVIVAIAGGIVGYFTGKPAK